jgi:hypothetical protein
MILDSIEGNLDGDSWEELCQSCYRIRYQDQHYTEIPAVQGGDGGIEGFTHTGIVNQCYCHEKNYSDDDLYKHQRIKMTNDINKLLSDKYKKKLKALGVPIIKEWHFVIPYYKDSRILEHAETKRDEVIKTKENNREQYDYIDDHFKVVIKQAEDFKFEISRIIRNSITDTKLNLDIRNIKILDWSSCDSEKANNIKNKVKAVMGDIEDDEDFKEIVNIYIESYIKGIEILKTLRISFPQMYEDVYSLEQAYKKQVKIKTMMNADKNMNISIFNEILNDFEKQLKESCKYFTLDSIYELKTGIISLWLADCSMKFRK